MVITFVSNYINHHQTPFCNAMAASPGTDFHFVQTEAMEAERIALKWDGRDAELPYVCDHRSDGVRAERLILESDVVLFGWNSLPEDLVTSRLSSGKATIRVSERIYREGQWKFLSPRGLMAKYRDHIRYRKAPVPLLCCGAYVASDFDLIRCYPDKMYRWGYFPETVVYTERQLKELKRKDDPVRLLWAGRMVPLKHPEFALRLADDLRREGYSFRMDLVGDGPMRRELEQMAESMELWEKVVFVPPMAPRDVRRIMDLSHIYLFTSNYLEGWGAVLNEAMNSGCAVVASAEAGATPFLVRDGENGLVYRDGSYEHLKEQTLRYMRDPKLRRECGERAAKTIRELWNAEEAAARLISFCETLCEGEIPEPFKDEGPLSAAPIIRPPGFARTRQEINRLQ